MPAEDAADEEFESLVADFLDAESRGEVVDREKIVREYPQYETQLREFFASHDALRVDRLSGNSSRDEWTLSLANLERRTLENAGDKGEQIRHTNASVNEPESRNLVHYFGDYELVEEIARGGMGIVYKARQLNLDRIVALKMILSGQLASPEDVERFHIEAEAAAKLDHPSIVPIIEIGEHQNQHYYSMGFVDGESLSQKQSGGPLVPREAAQITRHICDAMAYAHAQGVIHRDLKPSNILIDRNGSPKVTDFGLAKRMETNSGLTGTGQILGTPAYMSPEQAAGQIDTVGPLSDVYSIGALMYSLLTGRPPYHASTPMETLVQVLHDEAVSPRLLNPSVPVDLDTICMKCLQKDVGRRYQSANELADELERFLNGKPITARRISPIERSWRWCSRNPAWACVALLMLLLSIAIPASAVAIAYRESMLRMQTEDALFNNYASRAIASAQTGDSAVAALWFAKANQIARKESRQARLSRLGFEDPAQPLLRPYRVFWNEKQSVDHFAYDPTGRYFAILYSNGYCSVWNIHTNTRVLELESCSCFSWSHDGTCIAVADWDKQVKLVLAGDWESDTLIQLAENASAIQFSPDDSCVAISGQTLQLWSRTSNEFGTCSIQHDAPVEFIDFSANGEYVATTCRDDTLRIVKLGQELSGEVAFSALNHDWERGRFGSKVRPLFLQDGETLLTSDLLVVRWISLTTGRTIRTVEPDSVVLSWDLSEDGQTIVSGGREALQLWDTESGREIANLSKPDDLITNVSFSHSPGEFFACHEAGQTITINIATGERSSLRQSGEVVQARSSLENDSIATLQDDGLLRIWKFAPQDNESASVDTHIPLSGQCTRLRLSKDDKRLLVTGSSWWRGNLKTVGVFSSESMEPIGQLIDNSSLVTDATFSPDESLVVTCDIDKQVRFWDWQTGKEVRAAITVDYEPRAVEFDPDGDQLFVVCTSGHIQVFDGNMFSLAKRIRHGNLDWEGLRVRRNEHYYQDEFGNHQGKETGPRVLYLTFSPDGTSFATHGFDNSAIIWDTQKLVPICSPLESNDHVIAAEYSPDGSVVATASNDGIARIWDARSGELISSLEHPGWVLSISFSPKGDHLLTACKDGGARIWDWRNEEIAVSPMKQSSQMQDATYSRDAEWIISCTRSGGVQVWDAHLGLPIGQEHQSGGECAFAYLTPDGRSALVTGWFNSLFRIDLSFLDQGQNLNAEVALRTAELNSGFRVESGGIVALTTWEWLDRWRELEQVQKTEFNYQ